MTHLTELELSMYADGALDEEALARVEAQIAASEVCRERAAASLAQTQALTTALAVEHSAPPSVADIPKFSRPMSLKNFALANLGTGLVIWLVQFLWKTLFGELIVNATTWLTSVYLPDVYAVGSAAALHYIQEGTTMLETYLALVVVVLIGLSLLAAALMYRRARGALGICLAVSIASTAAIPTPVEALDFRRDDVSISVPATEVVEDTLIAASESIVIEGVVTGDLIALGQSVDVLGEVQGNLFAFAESVTVNGNVGGLVVSAGNNVSVRGARVAGDLVVASESLIVDEEASVGRNAVAAVNNLSVDGSVGTDVIAFAESVALRGVVGRDVEAFSNRVRLLGDSKIGGDLRFRGGQESRLHRADSASVAGSVTYPDAPEEFQEGNDYLSFEYYLFQLARFIAALLVGLCLLWLVPGLRDAEIGSGSDSLKSAGLGFLFLIGVPILAFFVAITIIGIPLALIGFAAYAACLYLAKIVVAAAVGRMLMADSTSTVLPFVAGLVVVIVGSALPFLGGIINFVLLLLGLGMLTQYVWGALKYRPAV